MSDGFQIACRCGHRAPIFEFLVSESGIDLPPRTYQCRACNEAWQVRIVEPGWVSSNGFVMPSRLACVPVDRTL